MKFIKNIVALIILIALLSSVISLSTVSAQSGLNINTNKNNVTKGEEIDANIYITNSAVAAFTLEIYFDTNKLEYVSGPANSNLVQNRVIYTWTSNNGKGQDKIEIHNLKFKAIADGTASIIATGIFYDANGKEVVLVPNNVEISIGDTANQMATDVQGQTKEASADNAQLQIFRLNEEGIIPTFDPNIYEYYFVTDKDINKFEITAIPQNKNASVSIKGNEDLKKGLNTITVKVTSENKSNTKNYKVYVTKTNDLEKANTNLETLAIRQGTLEPEFTANVTGYNIEIGNDTQTIDILAIPENVNAKVQIDGNGNMQIGDNKIVVTVIAEDGVTKRKYNINVHRRNAQEEEEATEEQANQVQKVASILNQQANSEIEGENRSAEAEQGQKNQDVVYVAIVTIIGIVILVIFILIVKRNLKKVD